MTVMVDLMQNAGLMLLAIAAISLSRAVRRHTRAIADLQSKRP